MAMLVILAACHKYFACGNKVLFWYKSKTSRQELVMVLKLCATACTAFNGKRKMLIVELIVSIRCAYGLNRRLQYQIQSIRTALHRAHLILGYFNIKNTPHLQLWP